MKHFSRLALAFFSIATSLCQAQTPTLWGMTTGGGTYGYGIIFNINNTTETNVHDFGNGTDGQAPFGSLIVANNGLLYGLTYTGGANGDGTIFSYTISTGIESDLYDFKGGTDGQGPLNTLLQASNGLLYGMTGQGGTNDENDIYGDGTIFSYNITTGTETVVHNFGSGTDGAEPQGSLIQASDGLLYGMTRIGGVNDDGIIFSYNISTGIETDLHDFNNTDGGNPYGTLTQTGNGLLYGMSFGGGNGAGAIFSYNISTGKETDLHDFNFGASDGSFLYGYPLQASDSLLYGLTAKGGTYNVGIIFSYNIFTTFETVLHDFGNGIDGANPEGSLIQASNGLYYGMTGAGGTNSKGTVFSYNSSTTTETVLHNFGSGSDGFNPSFADLLELDTLYATPFKSIICKGNSVTLIAGGAITYTWAPAAGLGATTGDSVTASPNTTTTYIITGTINSRTYTTNVTVTVIPSPVITVTSPTGQCNGKSETLTVSGGITYTWSPATGLSATTGDSVIASPTATTVYSVTGTGGAGGCTATLTDTAKIVSAPPLVIVPPSAQFCSGLRTTLSVISEGSGFEWSPSTGLNTTTGDSVTASPTVTVTYTVTGTDSLGCVTTGSDVVTVFLSPNKPGFTQYNDTLVSTSIHDNQWYRNDTLLAGDTSQYLIITTVGQYWVNVLNEANGCSTTSDTVNIASLTGINQLTMESGQVTVYPNPFSEQLTVISNQLIDEIDITNELGQVLLKVPLVGFRAARTTVQSGGGEIDLSYLPNAMYFITVITKTGRVVMPLVKQ